MRTMKIEKELYFDDTIQKVLQLRVKDDFVYHHEDAGIRVQGPLQISGTYLGKHGEATFQEILEMDVLAPKAKLDGTPFSLEVEQFDAIPQEDRILLCLQLMIKGLKDEKALQAEKEQEARMATLETATNKPVQIMPQEEPCEEEEVQETEEILQEGLEDLFEEEDSTYTSYRMVVAKPQDTYASIAMRYDVDEIALRDMNRNKEIQAKSLIILPFETTKVEKQDRV